MGSNKLIVRILHGSEEALEMKEIEVESEGEANLAIVINFAAVGDLQFEIDFPNGMTKFGSGANNKLSFNGQYKREA